MVYIYTLPWLLFSADFSEHEDNIYSWKYPKLDNKELQATDIYHLSEHNSRQVTIKSTQFESTGH